jgi:hypothetical protein
VHFAGPCCFTCPSLDRAPCTDATHRSKVPPRQKQTSLPFTSPERKLSQSANGLFDRCTVRNLRGAQPTIAAHKAVDKLLISRQQSSLFRIAAYGRGSSATINGAQRKGLTPQIKPIKPQSGYLTIAARCCHHDAADGSAVSSELSAYNLYGW